MVDIPPELQIKTLLCPGRTYLFKAEEHRGENKHFHVVLNTNIDDSDQIIMVAATTISIKQMTSYWDELAKQEVLVQAVVGDADFIKHPTLFRCDQPIVRSKAVIISKLSRGLLLQKGVLNSKLVDEWIKLLIRT